MSIKLSHNDLEDVPKILVVDDDPIVHKLLSAMLLQAGYDVAHCHRGQEALGQAVEISPDLILLDIMMPEMDGFAVIKGLKGEKATADIPVVFLSAKVDTAEKVKGLELGASDFINKPFDRAELIARIRTQVKLKKQEEKLKQYSQNLERMVEERTRQLIHADRLASLGTLSAGIAHEINNPTTFITGNLQTMSHFWKSVSEYIQVSLDNRDDAKIKYIVNEFPAMIDSISSGADRIANIVSGLKAFARKDVSIKESTDVIKSLEDALKLTDNRLKYRIKTSLNLPSHPIVIQANSQQLVQVFVNLILNAADAIGDDEGCITITARPLEQEFVRIEIGDDGPGIPGESLDHIFDAFFTTKPIGQGTGLGLTITHGIISNHGGSIKVTSNLGVGTVFTLDLPLEQKNG